MLMIDVDLLGMLHERLSQSIGLRIVGALVVSVCYALLPEILLKDVVRPSIERCPLSMNSFSGLPCLAKMLLKAPILDSPDVPVTTSTSGYLVSLFTTTSRYVPSLVGPQWSAARSCHGSYGGGVGWSGYFQVTLVPA